LLIPLILSTIIGIISSYVLWTNKNKTTKKKGFIEKSPFNFKPAIKFTILLAIILIVSKVSNDLIGDKGTYITSIIAGLVDTDAITLSIATLSGTSISYNTGMTAVLIACLTNTIVKLLITRTVGSKELFKKMLLNYILMSLPLIVFIFLGF
jgi:uncharacterized membrane protein (DUF4010 family)